mmetsp:Transcript_24376/g.40330  ORF Transcript_24376/g.40330 Transcript_24376/m.40330 type:complete len:316 (+) Transcript_24376:18-965(+)|eukprot:CAMPEP_0119340064 /NCGR_PEP_ID=MMETSP1333-20130426/99607_1 /TAXON_ID=418940 /ORGANISM="Scyphosphaera apsteinii, Strain RCC1455" /LENGTH=315 /DNA_ID=CAMNT_0007351723 /DNA_START=25 /DNA_END=972 /DNA_ORIENTATION=-
MSSRERKEKIQAEKSEREMILRDVKTLMKDNTFTRSMLSEARTTMDGLRNAVGALKTELKFVSSHVEQMVDELKHNTTQRLAGLQGEIQTAVHEIAGLKSQVAIIENGMETVQTTQAEHAKHLKDVAVVKTQHQFVQSNAARTEQAVIEHTKLINEMRAELAGLSQRHAALSSGCSAERAAQTQQTAGLRSSFETHSMQLEQAQAQVAALHASEDNAQRTAEKLKKAVKRQELLLQRISEVHETRSSELRGLVKAVAEQLRPLQDASHRHDSQIEECCSGINVLSELLRFSNRGRATTGSSAYADVLHSFRAGNT